MGQTHGGHARGEDIHMEGDLHGGVLHPDGTFAWNIGIHTWDIHTWDILKSGSKGMCVLWPVTELNQKQGQESEELDQSIGDSPTGRKRYSIAQR